MAKQEYKILEFHGGTNSKSDPRDIAENQNAFAQMSVDNPGRLVVEGSALSLYSKTDLNGRTISDITASPGGFESSYGLYTFSHDYDMETTPDEIDTDFIVTNDKQSIYIYDPNQSNEWSAVTNGLKTASGLASLGSRTTDVKPSYYNVDGGLRACDSNFGTTDTSADTSAAITKNDVVLSIDNGGGGNVTIATYSIIQIDQEIMFVTSGGTGQSFTVVRGYANTKIQAHADNTNVYYVNIPKYMGHIKQDRLFECASSDSINTWVDDVLTPQPPNNTRKSDGTNATLSNSLGIQSLRIYDSITSSTTNYPAESEKVVVEFGETAGNVGIIEIDHGDYAGANFLITTSGYGNSATADHKLQTGDIVNFTDMQGVAGDLSGEHEVVARISATQFTIFVEGDDSSWALDYETSEVYESNISDWADYSDENEAVDGLKVICGTSDDDFTPGEAPFPVHITGETGVLAFNGIFIANTIDADSIYIRNSSHGSHASGTANGKVQQLVGIIRPQDFEGIINEDLKRKWEFAMSFTYDGPGQEVQESLLTNGFKVEQAVKTDGTPNNLDDTTTSGGIDADDTPIQVLDNSTFSVNDIIMIGTEQMLVTAIDADGFHMAVTRGYNNTTAASHTTGAPIFKITELTPTATVDWTNFVGVPKCVIKTVYNYGVDEKSWLPRINGFKIYMKDVTEEDEAGDWRLFSHLNFNKGTYRIFAAGDSELILEQPGTWSSDGALCTINTGTSLTMKPVDTYLSENLFTEDTIIDAQYKVSCVAGRKVYIGNIRQGGKTYPDRMIRSVVNKFDTFPETNFIDVAVGDGDKIVALESFGDRLLQFKNKKLYVINISGQSEVLESEYINAGTSGPSAVVKTELGIAWINSWGLWFFDGKQVKNLTRDIRGGGYYAHSTNAGFIGYDAKGSRLIFTSAVLSGMITNWEIFDLKHGALQSYHVGTIIPFSESGENHYTNFINDSEGNVILGFVDGGTATELNFYKWDTSKKQSQNTSFPVLWKSKDIDVVGMSSSGGVVPGPAIDKKIYKIYVTYKCTGHSGVQMKYTTDGGRQGNFSINPLDKTFKSNDNYDAVVSDTTSAVGTFTGNGTCTGFKDTNGEWKVAELKPSTSINNVKSIQLSFEQIIIDDGRAQGGSSTTIQVDDGNSTDLNAYVDYNIHVYGGPARFNTKKITGYAVNRTATVAEMTDNGYADAATNASKYILGAVAPDFEVNDITIIFKAKRVK